MMEQLDKMAVRRPTASSTASTIHRRASRSEARRQMAVGQRPARGDEPRTLEQIVRLAEAA